MLEIGPQELSAWLDAHWRVAAWLAATIIGATGVAMAILPRARREDVALWMMGAASDITWAKSFTTLKRPA
tara:strand:- start:142 stop:354 length:213 start_codon:yes stop_codon:yes gene_type:complete